MAPIIERCAVEPDFYVRDMLTWALTRHDPARTVDLLLAELASPTPQARSQALHTLSKIGDRRAWSAITVELLHDDDDEVARAAWRTAVGLVPDGERTSLAELLATQLGRGGLELQRSLSRALLGLGDAASPVVTAAMTDRRPGVRAHALATERLLRDPDEDFAAALHEARWVVALRAAPDWTE
ncbi:HEAT repeat protein [Diaminobutyricimonas aerilata]|uniref:HEAT repeat protein n=1 Tax=Diaminobutyricimonas aerilata TaxID=1162967 RepID=A0A2M9CKD2_9MICO|nr:HEAT repeat domain-containing protein [Diaminobutyricimonas aerilata]PJJ72353.1 HEAT repeat protein [Diaminobutyricimonas aerilata]